MTTSLATQTRQRPKPPSLKAPQVGMPNEKSVAQTLKSRTDRPDRTEHRIRACLALVAELLAHSDDYLPIFLRLEAELAAAEARHAALDRARVLLGSKG